jgi:aspartate aminotransferase-like enzyme
MTFGTFFVPGPTEVHPDVLAAMTRPMLSHRGSEFEEVFVRVQSGMSKIFFTGRPVFIGTSSGTGMMEAAVRCAPKGKILSLVNGGFSERFAKIAESCGREVSRYEVPWGSAHDTGELERRLGSDQFVAVTVGHSETSTGVLNDIRAISDAAHGHGCLCLIDAVSSLAGAELRFDEWGLDLLLTGSQKALALPPGLAFAAVSEKYLELARGNPQRGTYFDLVEFEEFARKRQAPNTPAVSLYFALDVQLKRILAEGIEARWARHGAMQRQVLTWIAKRGLRAIAVEGSRSPTVTAIEISPDADVAWFISRVAERGITLGTGYGKLGKSTFRIGHMGDHTPETVKKCLDACDAGLA